MTEHSDNEFLCCSISQLNQCSAFAITNYNTLVMCTVLPTVILLHVIDRYIFIILRIFFSRKINYQKTWKINFWKKCLLKKLYRISQFILCYRGSAPLYHLFSWRASPPRPHRGPALRLQVLNGWNWPFINIGLLDMEE